MSTNAIGSPSASQFPRWRGTRASVRIGQSSTRERTPSSSSTPILIDVNQPTCVTFRVFKNINLLSGRPCACRCVHPLGAALMTYLRNCLPTKKRSDIAAQEVLDGKKSISSEYTLRDANYDSYVEVEARSVHMIRSPNLFSSLRFSCSQAK